MHYLVTSLGLLLVAAAAQAALPDIFAYPDSASAQQAWQPQFGSPPVRVDALPDGACVVLEGTFKGAGDRLCWDWIGPLDLSQADAVCADLRSENAGLVGNFAVYFGAPGGWYARFGWGGPADAWTRRTWQLGDFGTEDKPAGWDQVNRFRFSVWGTAPGKVTFRLRGFKALPRDLQRNFLRNGSFEVPGPLPYAWGNGHWGIGNLPWAADTALWRRHFALDRKQAHDGRLSLRVTNAADLPRLQAQSVWFGLPGAPTATYTASAWLQADRDDLPVTFSCGERSASLKIGKVWQRALLPGIPPEAQQRVTLAAAAEGSLWIDAVQVQANGQDTEAFHPHPEDEGLCQREAQVDWSPPRRTADIAAGRLTTGPLRPGKVAIDGNGRFLLDGQPYLQHSLGLEFVSDVKMLDAAAAAGFPDICIEVRKTITTDELRAWFDRCAELGLHVIPWLDGDIPLERFRSHLSTLKDHPALLCWYVFDEPSGERFAEANTRLTLAHELDPGHPALINYLGDKLTGHMGDIYSTDIYPIPHGTPSAAIQGVAAMAAAAGKEHKPVWMWLQGTGYAYWMDREPTPRELSCMVYGSLIAGARGIYYFAQVPRSQECWAEMRALCAELPRLTPVLGSLDPAPAMRCDSPGLMVQSYRQGNEVWVLAVNTRREPCEPKLGLAVSASTGEVVFEGREVPLKSGEWTDSFGPYERHVYRLKAEPAKAVERVCIEGVERYRVCEPLFECVRVVLAKRGESYSADYLQGISGAAFRIAGICPCAPTCSAAMQTEALVELLGYKATRLNLDDKGAAKVQDLAAAMQANGKVLPEEAKLATPALRELRQELLAIIAAVKSEIRAGRPVIVWHAFTNAEYDVVAGFDDAKGTFLGRGSYAGSGPELASAAQTRTLTAVTIGGPPGAILVGEKHGAFDARKAEIAALQEAVRHAHSSKNQAEIGKKPWVMLEGLAAYDQWLRHFSDPAAKRGTGDAYCYGIYRSTHRAAAGFLREIAPQHPAAQAQLAEAASHFAVEADTLQAAEGLLGWDSPEGPDAARNQRAVQALTRARAEYAASIEAIESALAVLGLAVETPVPAK